MFNPFFRIRNIIEQPLCPCNYSFLDAMKWTPYFMRIKKLFLEKFIKAAPTRLTVGGGMLVSLVPAKTWMSDRSLNPSRSAFDGNISYKHLFFLASRAAARAALIFRLSLEEGTQQSNPGNVFTEINILNSLPPASETQQQRINI